ncbi:hypothetical protein [Streptomyces sp. NPDC086838]|uniref:hypothetical protein n=1 Tax=Streptomyces sp. NPDC086838 TaxID=3365762 RepID=UPI00381EE786
MRCTTSPARRGAEAAEQSGLRARVRQTPQNVSGTPSVVVYPDYRIRVFANDGQGHVVTAAQAAENGAYGSWETIVPVAPAFEGRSLPKPSDS